MISLLNTNSYLLSLVNINALKRHYWPVYIIEFSPLNDLFNEKQQQCLNEYSVLHPNHWKACRASSNLFHSAQLVEMLRFLVGVSGSWYVISFGTLRKITLFSVELLNLSKLLFKLNKLLILCVQRSGFTKNYHWHKILQCPRDKIGCIHKSHVHSSAKWKLLDSSL